MTATTFDALGTDDARTELLASLSPHRVPGGRIMDRDPRAVRQIEEREKEHMSQAEFSLSFRGLTSGQLRDALAATEALAPATQQALTFEIRSAPNDTRSVDPTILVAVTGVIGTVIGTVLTGLFQLAQGRKRGTIVVVTRTGTHLEAPVDATPEELDLFVRKARELDVAHVHVSGTDRH